MARAQIAVLRKSADVADLKIELLDQLSAIQMHLNPVREKAEVIKRVKSDEFWNGVTVADLESVRKPLREIMHHRDRLGAMPLQDCASQLAGHYAQAEAGKPVVPDEILGRLNLGGDDHAFLSVSAWPAIRS